MGIRFFCPNGHKLNVKSFLAGKRGICPYCGVVVQIPLQSTRPSSKELRAQRRRALEAKGEAIPLEGEDGSDRGIMGPISEPVSGPASGPDQPAWTARIPEAKATTTLLGPGTLPTGQARPTSPSRLSPPSLDRPVPPAPASAPSRSVFEPLDQDPTAIWYVMPAQGGRYGPASGAVMRTWIMEGRIGVDTLVWRSGWPEWRQAGEVFPNLEKFLESLAQRLAPAEVAPPVPIPSPREMRVPGRPAFPQAPVAEENGRNYVLPIVVAAIIGGIGIAAFVLLILARSAG